MAVQHERVWTPKGCRGGGGHEALFYSPDAAGPALATVGHLFWQKCNILQVALQDFYSELSFMLNGQCLPKTQASFSLCFSCFPLPTWLQCLVLIP